ncbi:MAG: hypothetical protein INR69_14315 [Mucilaginibacter polytrichastri]|nr:hypothetical protein [Mucilaginibacter polytrichastri]
MTIYRFKVTFEDFDDVVREIDIRSNQTFEDLHVAIHKSINYSHEVSSSFYVSNDQWIKGEEIAYQPSDKKKQRGVTLMEAARLSRFIDDPHQKFYYTSNFDRPFDFHVELVKILEAAPGKDYPLVGKSAGEPPKQFGLAPNPTILPPTSEEFDFLNEMEFNPEDAEEFSEVTDTSSEEESEEESGDSESGEEDEFGDEFSDNENYDEDDRRGGRDDY